MGNGVADEDVEQSLKYSFNNKQMWLIVKKMFHMFVAFCENATNFAILVLSLDTCKIIMPLSLYSYTTLFKETEKI